MKNKIRLSLCVLLTVVSVAGCKPKEAEANPQHPTASPRSESATQNSTAVLREIPKPASKEVSLSGQIFIVTQGSENIKLGLVEVSLVPKAEVVEFLKKKSLPIETEAANRQEQMEAAKARAKKSQNECASYLTNGPLAQFDYKSMKSQYMPLVERLQTLQNKQKELDEKLHDGNHADWDSAYPIFAAQKQAIGEAQGIITNLATLQPIAEKCEKIEGDAKLEIAHLLTEYTSASNDFVRAYSKSMTFPPAESYIADFPASEQKTLSDADGRFAFKYAQEKTYSLYAKASRTVGTNTEQYFWLVDAPTNSEIAQILLSNHNLVYTDPDGYFKTKPKVATAAIEPAETANE